MTPALVILSWILGIPRSLSLKPFRSVVFFLSVVVVEGLIADGDSNLEGTMLARTLLIIAVAFFVYVE